MASISRALKYLLHNRSQFFDSLTKNLGGVLSDKTYLTLRYRFIFGSWINWEKPKKLTEKIQWLKLYDYKTEYIEIVDKRSAKNYVADLIGKRYIIPTLAEWNRVQDINWESLPNQFVLKTTHGGGGCGVVVCSNKMNFDKSEAITKLQGSMNGIVGKEFRERPYYYVPKKIIAEKFMIDSNGELKDYKFFCFNGKALCFKVDFGRFTEHHANYYDPQGNLLPFGEIGLEPDYSHKEILPTNLSKMIDIAEKLSKGIKFLRVDLYNIDGEIFFGELTLYPGGGMVPFTSIEWDRKLGDFLNLD